MATALNNLAYPLRQRGRYEEAAAALDEGLRIVGPTLGSDHPLAATLATNLAHVRLVQGDAVAAETLARGALRVRRSVLAKDDWRIGMTKSLLGASLTALGRYAEAERFLLDAGAVLRDVPGQQGREAEANRVRIRELYAIWNRDASAPRSPGSPASSFQF